jgi:hypothetical protein
MMQCDCSFTGPRTRANRTLAEIRFVPPTQRSSARDITTR